MSTFGRELEKRGDHLEVALAIRDQEHTVSRLADLNHAADLVALLTQLEENKERLREERSAWDDFVNAQAAVLAHAVVLYVRAAAPGDQGRKLNFRVEEVLTGAALRIHASLKAARDTALAHFDGPERQDWHADCLVMIKHENGDWHYGSTFSRGGYRSTTHKDLKLVLDELIPWVDNFSTAGMDALNTRLQQAIADDPSLDHLIEANPFDDKAFYGGSPEGEAATRAMLGGGIGNHVWHSSMSSSSEA
ncbi:MAG: hypothetical protein V4597_04680 [Pseudomonadota bacterium]